MKQFVVLHVTQHSDNKFHLSTILLLNANLLISSLDLFSAPALEYWNKGAMGSFFWGGAHGERVEREPITGVLGQSPQRGPGAEPGFGSW